MTVDQFRLLASFIAGRALEVAEAPPRERAHTNGVAIFVTAGASIPEQRREVLVQSALLGAGSLDSTYVKALRGRPSVARRYLSLEGVRVLDHLAGHLPLAAELRPIAHTETTTAGESLEFARGRGKIADPPPWFGVIKPSRLTAEMPGSSAPATDKDLQTRFDMGDTAEDGDEDDDLADESRILKLFEVPVTTTQTLSDFLTKLFGKSRRSSGSTPGGEMQAESMRRSSVVGADARPMPTRITFTDENRPAHAVGGALYPEWDFFHSRYRPDWCRVVDFPLTVTADVSAAGVLRDEVLRRRVSRIGLGPRALRARPDGDDLDIEALVDMFVDLRSGYSPPENVYTDRRKIARDLGVLILLDASGSATDTDPHGLAVHDHQRRAAATLAATLEELGDRVAVYAFRSMGRHAVHLPAIKTFGQRFGALARARLNRLQPSGYTRLGAGIRGAGEILKNEAGTPHRLLLVLSDGFPFDTGYEGRYAEADCRRALEEIRADGVASLCLSIGATAEPAALQRIFGSSTLASASTMADLSPRMDELFLTALQELSTPKQ